MKAVEKYVFFFIYHMVTEEPHVLQGNTVLHSIFRGERVTFLRQFTDYQQYG